MKTWKHINEEQRKIIASGIAHNKKLYEIAEAISVDPRSVSREVKRNRISYDFKDINTRCPKLNRWPYVCANCTNKYKNCKFIRLKYDSKIANDQAIANLINSRKGLDLDSEDFKKIDTIIKNGIDNNKSLYQISIESKNDINKSVTTLYRYVNKGYLSTTRLDLPFAVKYKKRKHKKKYEYSNNKIDRSNHTYLDYLSYIHNNPHCTVWQLDFLGAIKTDSKNILSLILPTVHFTILGIIENPNSDKVVKFFDDLEDKIGTQNFIDLFQVILTDRDPCFNDILGICFSKLTGEERCKLFFCDPYVSNQKPHDENINKQIRKFFPKGQSVNHHTPKSVRKHNLTLLDTPLKSLDGYTPKDAFIAVYNEDMFNKIFVNDER